MSCLGCGATLTKRHQKVYCSNRRQRAMERRSKIERWLSTGVAQTATNVGHYIRTYLLEAQQHACAICGCSTRYAEGKSY